MAAVLALALALAVSAGRAATAAAQDTSSTPSAPTAASDWDMFANGLQVLWGAYDGCARGADDVSSCLKLRALRSAERALRAERLPLLGGLAFVREQGREGRRLAEDETPPLDETALPVDAAAKQRALDDALLDRIARFFKGHTLQLDSARLLEEDAAEEAEGEQGAEEGEDGAAAEGRRRKGLKRYGGALLLGLMMKGGLMAMAWKGVALMAAKALMVAKIALVLSAVVALKKLSHGGGHGDEKVTYEIVKHPHVSHTQTFSTGHDFGGHDFGGSGGGGGGGGGHYKRSLDPLQPQHAHALAYTAHAPAHGHAHVHWHAPYPRARLHALQHQQQPRPQVALYHYPSTQEILHHQEQLEDIHQQQQLQEQEQQQQQQQQQQEYAYEVNDPTQEAEQDIQPVYPYPQQ